MPDPRELLAGQAGTDANDEKGYFFKLDNEQRCHRLG